MKPSDARLEDTMKKTMVLLASLMAVSSAVLGACSSDETGGQGGSGGNAAQCNEDPWSCPAGQTCWFGNTEGSQFSCLNSGQGKAGDPCQNVVNSPSCGDALMCFQAPGSAMGVCTPFCDPSNPAHACPNQAKCQTAQTQGGLLLRICDPSGLGGQGGGGGGQGGGGQGGSGQGGSGGGQGGSP